ncbi:MAG: type II toxin-antitoxin system VapB family antitoxin, partial [Pseudomonadota bacterium]|nr:type II toxin-antitoxin system VapB family antitoxin [Pseudomonadota bacterium]
AMKRAGVRTKKAAIEAALRAYVRQPDYAGLLALEGSGVLADDYDPAALFNHSVPDWGSEPMHVAEPTPTYGSGTTRPKARR